MHTHTCRYVYEAGATDTVSGFIAFLKAFSMAANTVSGFYNAKNINSHTFDHTCDHTVIYTEN